MNIRTKEEARKGARFPGPAASCPKATPPAAGLGEEQADRWGGRAGARFSRANGSRRQLPGDLGVNQEPSVCGLAGKLLPVFLLALQGRCKRDARRTGLLGGLKTLQASSARCGEMGAGRGVLCSVAGRAEWLLPPLTFRQKFGHVEDSFPANDTSAPETVAC